MRDIPGGDRGGRRARLAGEAGDAVAFLLGALAVVLVLLAAATGVLVWQRAQPPADAGAAATSITPAAASGPSAEPAASTSPPPAPAAAALVAVAQEGPEADAVAAVLADYAGGINAGDYALAHRQLTAARQAEIPYERFAQDHSTSRWSDVLVSEVTRSGEVLSAVMTFTTRQSAQHAPAPGVECAVWTLVFTFEPGGEHGWLIGRPHEVAGVPVFTACPS